MILLIKYRLVSIFREKLIIFWSLCFPFLLGTLFYASFGNISNNLDRIDTAYVEEKTGDTSNAFYMVLSQIQSEDKDFLSVKKMSDSEAKKKLKDGKISGIYYAGDEVELCVASSGVRASILESILSNFNNQMTIIKNVSMEKPEKIKEIALNMNAELQKQYVKETNLGGEESNGMIQYFFALVAMGLMFGGYLGIEVSTTLQANTSSVGIRNSVSSTSKMKLVISCAVSILLIEFLDSVGLLCYLKYVFGLNMGDDWPAMIAVCFFGSLIGVSIGMLVGSLSKVSEEGKAGIITMFGLASSFLSGLMVAGIKGLIEDHCPILNRINPSSIIADAFYSISIYPDRERFISDITILGVMAAVLLFVSIAKLRRVRYDCI